MENAQVICKMDSSGRITIPEEIRSKVCAEEGTRFELCYDEQKAEITLRKYNPYKEILVYLNNAICDMGLLCVEVGLINENEHDEIAKAMSEIGDIFMRMKAIILK